MNRDYTSINTLVFDLDGTIADSLMIGVECANQLADKYKYQPIVVTPVIRDLSAKELIKTQLKLGKIRLIFWAKELRRLISQNNDNIKVFPQMKETLEALHTKGFTLGILTSNSTNNTLKILKNHQIEHLFKFIYTKSSPLGKWYSLWVMLRKERLSKKEVVYIGDEIRDIDACDFINIPIIAVTWGANSSKVLTDAGADFYANEPKDLLEAAKKFAGAN